LLITQARRPGVPPGLSCYTRSRCGRKRFLLFFACTARGGDLRKGKRLGKNDRFGVEETAKRGAPLLPAFGPVEWHRSELPVRILRYSLRRAG
jgi:hypothetical protein